jgi:hypothetical protein
MVSREVYSSAMTRPRIMQYQRMPSSDATRSYTAGGGCSVCQSTGRIHCGSRRST